MKTYMVKNQDDKMILVRVQSRKMRQIKGFAKYLNEYSFCNYNNNNIIRCCSQFSEKKSQIESLSQQNLVQLAKKAKFQGFQNLQQAIKNDPDYVQNFLAIESAVQFSLDQHIQQIQNQIQQVDRGIISDEISQEGDQEEQKQKQKLFEILEIQQEQLQKVVLQRLINHPGCKLSDVVKTIQYFQKIGVSNKRIICEILKRRSYQKLWLKTSTNKLERLFLELQLMGFEKDVVIEIIFCEGFRRKLIPGNVRDLCFILEDTGIVDNSSENSFNQLIYSQPRLVYCHTRQLKQKIQILLEYGMSAFEVQQLLVNAPGGFVTTIKKLKQCMELFFQLSLKDEVIAVLVQKPSYITNSKRSHNFQQELQKNRQDNYEPEQVENVKK
eukprot:TRINITY_DN3125_c1_g1_i3.p1 TRINITY_DN3125_c1_g1~~TRINITY_DN3125_c1_g1_i3.p1  ORF type:complete len:383 (-),score=25.12 TRINITY_DN3125_c1_g1_i3:370-1518(-)